MANITLFAQVIQQLPKELIKSLIKKHETDKHAKGFNTWSHLVSMFFYLFSGCDSARDVSKVWKSATGNLNHLRISRAPSKSTLSERQPRQRCVQALFQYFGQQACWQRKGFWFKMPIKLLDSTLVSLTLSVNDWAHYTTKKGRSRCIHCLTTIVSCLNL